MGDALQDVQDAPGHADPCTTRRYDRSRHNLDRSPNYLLAAFLTKDSAKRTFWVQELCLPPAYEPVDLWLWRASGGIRASRPGRPASSTTLVRHLEQ